MNPLTRRLGPALLLLAAALPAPGAQPLRVCSDVNYWYPFTFARDGRAAGLHVDIVGTTLTRLGHAFEITPLPWKRCLHEAERGSVDAVLTASYQDGRAAYLEYPPDAATAPTSKWRVTQVEYVVVTAAQDPYEFDGDVRSLPAPVRAPLGYSVADDLRRAGVAVEEAPGDENNLRKLARDARGVAISVPEVVTAYGRDPELKGRLRVSRKPISSKSYFLAFSKSGRLTPAERQRVWDAIAKVREDEALMAGFIRRYATGP